MKKSVFVLILIIYVASIIIIGFYGVRISTFNVTIYVDKIELLNDNVILSGGNNYIILDFEPDYDPISNPNVVQLIAKVYPEDATYRNVAFEHAENSRASVNNIGTVIFTGTTTLTVYIRSTDGGVAEYIINIISRIKN